MQLYLVTRVKDCMIDLLHIDLLARVVDKVMNM